MRDSVTSLYDLVDKGDNFGNSSILKLFLQDVSGSISSYSELLSDESLHMNVL